MPIESIVILPYVGTNASLASLAHWSRVSALDGRYVKQIPTSGTNPGTQAGSATHTHPFQAHSTHTWSGHNHPGTWGNSGAGPGAQAEALIHTPSVTACTAGHNHAISGAAASAIASSNNSTPTDTDTGPNDTEVLAVIFIQSDGQALGIPVDAIAWFNGAIPSSGGWANYASLDNRLMKGAIAGGDGGVQAGSSAHTHTTATHTHPIGGTHVHPLTLDLNPGLSVIYNGGEWTAPNPHTHTGGNSATASNPANSDSASETSGSGDFLPPWQKLRAGRKINTAGESKGMIALTLASIATIATHSRWKLADGTSGTPNLCQGKYVRAATTDGEVGNTGGSATHTHAAGTPHSHGATGTHNHTSANTSGGESSGNTNAGGGTSVGISFGDHNHLVQGTSSTDTISTSTANATTQQASASLDPVNTTVGYIQLMVEDPMSPLILMSD